MAELGKLTEVKDGKHNDIADKVATVVSSIKLIVII